MVASKAFSASSTNAKWWAYRAVNRLPSSRSRPPQQLGNGHTGQWLSGAGQVSCRAKPSFQRPLRVRLGISWTSTAVRLTEIWAHHQIGHRADLCCEQHDQLACREPNKDFGTHLRRRIPCGTPTPGTGPPIVVPQWSCGLRHSLRNGADAIERATDQECTGGPLCLCRQRARRRCGVSPEVAGQLPGPIVAIARRCDAAKRQPSWPRRSQGPQSE